jgi:hypothetical protein
MRHTRKQPRSDAGYGWHNQHLDDSVARIQRGNTYGNLSTVWLTPTTGSIWPRVVNSWMGLMRPMNQAVVGPLFLEGDEVGVAYQKGFEMILDHQDLSKFKYVLTVEHDNCPPPDGLLRLYESIADYDVVQGLYWTKGIEGQPMCYGDPAVMPINFVPQPPPGPNEIRRYRGLGMGFCLFRLDMFRKLDKPWFRTIQEPGRGMTQDLYFYERAGKAGFKFACDGRVRVGHWDQAGGMMW